MDLSNYQQKPKSKITNERQLLIKDFIDRLNSERGNYPPLDASRVARDLAYIKTSNLKSFYDECNYAKNFSAYYWWCFKEAKKK